MPRLIRFPQQDERPTPAPPDFDDAWWAGMQRCFVAIPLAGTVAAVALSASLAFGYQQQTDEIVPQPAITIVEEDAWQRPVWIIPPITILGPSWDDQTVSLLQVEEESWQPPVLRKTSPPLQPWAADEEIVPQPTVFVPDEDLWFPPILRFAPPIPTVWATDDDFVFTPPTPLGVDEDYWWTVLSLPGVLSAPVWVVDDEIVPPPPPTEIALDAGAWTIQRLPPSRRIVTVY